MQTKYVVIIGSVMSGLGKGGVTSSILKILDFYDYKALPVKFDGYLNYDCGTMNPYRHGEVFVLDDKSEVDMDFGMYERFTNNGLTGELSITGGKLFNLVITKERKGDYLGEDVQIIPHLTNEIIGIVENIAKKKQVDVLVIEVGGTIGDIENSYFIEAMRQLSLKHEVVFVDLTYIPSIDVVGEQKTKPAQLGFRSLLGSGIIPNFVICRSDVALSEKAKSKLALFSSLSGDRIIDDATQRTLYNLPLHFMKQGFDTLLLNDLDMKNRKLNKKKFDTWKGKINRILNPKHRVKIAIVGKYTNLKDSYASVNEALVHAGAYNDTKVNIDWVESTDLEKGDLSKLKNADGILVPGGFGGRGIEGMIKAIEYARKNEIPYLGLCLGLQLMVIEYARDVNGLKNANSTEFDEKAKYNVIDLMESQQDIKMKGGTMRLGSWKCKIPDKDSIAYRAYKTDLVEERHRHRYEVNNKYRKTLQNKGLKISGVTPNNALVEFVEWPDSFGVATQAHPELKSRLEQPAPLFVSFIEAARQLSDKRSK